MGSAMGSKEMHKTRWAVLIVAICLIVTAAAVAYAAGKRRATAPVLDTLMARRFVLVYDRGKVRAALLVVDGNPALALQDDQGRTRAILQLRSPKSNPTLVLDDKAGKTRAMLTLHDDDQPGVAFFDASGSVTWKTP